MKGVMTMKRILLLTLALCMLCQAALAADLVIEPQWPVPDYVTKLLEIATGELGYRESAYGVTKFGEWAGNPQAQWCAEYLCWCVDQVDQRYGTQLLRRVYPLYSGSNTGRSWFIREGRYITRNGRLDGWGYQWLQGTDSYITTGSYIPQPGDWVFFTWDSDNDTDHVAMVEYCSRKKDGSVVIHVLEGNNPDRVQRNTYDLTYNRILGYGTVHDVADWTMRTGNTGEKVRQLQEKLVKIEYMAPQRVSGEYDVYTVQAVQAYQRSIGEKDSGIATITTQLMLDKDVQDALLRSPGVWSVVDDDDDD